MKVVEIAFSVYPVTDLKRARAFYEETLGLKAARVPEGADETLPHQYTADPKEAPAPVPAGVGAQLEG